MSFAAPAMLVRAKLTVSLTRWPTPRRCRPAGGRCWRVKVDEVAWPLRARWSAVEVRLRGAAKVPEAPLAGAVKVTVAPVTGLLNWSMTWTTSGLAKPC